MALRELPRAFGRLVLRPAKPSAIASAACVAGRRYNATAAPNSDLADLETESSLNANEPTEETIKAYDPLKRARARKVQLPPSRYHYRSPKYYRGPLHPHQPPPTSDPASRQFVPGPFNLPRMKQTFESTVAQDLMTLAYLHREPGHVEQPKNDRLREWDDSSPYHKNRPKRGPRGNKPLRLIEHNIRWNNVPTIDKVVVHSMVKNAVEDSAHLHVAGIMLQSITGVRPVVHKTKKHSNFGLRPNKAISLTCTLSGNEAWEFIDKCVNIVFPRIKDWPGVKGSSGDNSGNISFGLDSDSAMLFPELEVNYDMYPPHMIPGFHVTVQTSARSDRHARLLLSALGMPFYGEYVNY